MEATEGEQTCCGLPVLIDGSCKHRSYHPRQITPEMILLASASLNRCSCPGMRISVECPAHGTTEAKVRAVLGAVL